MKVRDLVIGAMLAGGVAGVPFVATAQTAGELRAQIADLLQQINALRVQLQTQSDTQAGQAVPAPRTHTPRITTAPQSDSACLALTTSLSRGARGENVRKLQHFLTITGHYTYGEITGYYGPVTQRAVQRFQTAHGIVSAGTPVTTGYGRVGPSTRRVMRSSCEGAAGNEAVARDLVVTPTVGQLPLQVTATFSISGSSCSSYSLDWGDGTRPLVFSAHQQGSCTKDIAHKRITHTYTTPGTHAIVFRAGRGPIEQARVAGRAFISVGDTAPRGFSIHPISGSAPLTTSITFPVLSSSCTAYEADWGDGTVDRYEPPSFVECTQDSGTQAISHTYTNAGTYQVQFKTGRKPISALPVNERWQVVVRNDVSGGPTVEVEPTSGTAPLIVTVNMYGTGEQCTSYSLDWGDGSSIQQYEADREDCSGGRFTHTFAHTYFSPGNYDITTKIGKSTSLDTLPTNTQPIVVRVQ